MKHKALPENNHNLLELTERDKKFRGITGQLFMRYLFLETCPMEHREKAIYTLKRYHRPHHQSLYLLFMEMDDPTEYFFGEKYFYDYQHWKKLSEAAWFKEYVEEWREEIALKHKALALQELKKEAGDPENKNYFNANKYLLDKGWIEKPKRVTRTAKKAIEEEAQKMSEEKKDINDDYMRILN